MTVNEKLFDYIKNSPTPYHAVSHTAEILKNAGYTEISESDRWSLREGGKYFVIRGGSSLISFRIPSANFKGFMLTAAHSDSPTFRIKENAELKGTYIRLSTERYGGMLCSTWMDRPLSVAGRLVCRDGDSVNVKLVDMKKPCAVIPNVAIHMNRSANDGMKYNPAVDMIPLYAAGINEVSFSDDVARVAEIEKDSILSSDLMLYCPEDGIEFNGLISAPRLDDLQCAFASLEAFVSADCSTESVPVYCLFDNEEVGSLTRQGADSTFLKDVLSRISNAYGESEDYSRRVANSFLVSCDNAHAVHPNHPEYSDQNHTVKLGGGIVIKYNANQKYTSDAVSTGIFKMICDRAGAKYQTYANRADMPGGSTLGNISNAHVSLISIDIGLPQLAMHSAYETAGADDTENMIRALKTFFATSLTQNSSAKFEINT
ncbi:MAG: M18 family aminopeptidase [Clostridia bacterium]|nr:M18 family aminopeptidase [Clostridia bacterium]